MSCIFCKIINKEAPTNLVYEDERVIAIKDIYPKAPIHILIIPKKHIESVRRLENSDKELIGELILVAKKIAEDYNPPTTSSRRQSRRAPKKLEGYKLVINVGREGGQIIEHLHLHLLGGKPVELP